MVEELVNKKLVKCASNLGFESDLTEGRSYEVTVTTYNNYFVINDNQKEKLYPQWLFEKNDAMTEW